MDDFLHIQAICITDLYECVNSYAVIILYVLYAFDVFHILFSGDSLRDLWNVYMYVYTQHNFIYQNAKFVCYIVDIRGWDGVFNVETWLWAD